MIRIFVPKNEYSFEHTFFLAYRIILSKVPVDTGRKLNVHKTFRRRPKCLLNVLCAFNLRPVSTWVLQIKMFLFLPKLNYVNLNFVTFQLESMSQQKDNENGISISSRKFSCQNAPNIKPLLFGFVTSLNYGTKKFGIFHLFKTLWNTNFKML